MVDQITGRDRVPPIGAPADGEAYVVPAGYSGVNAGYRSYVFAQCFSGGMLDDLSFDATTFGAASSRRP